MENAIINGIRIVLSGTEFAIRLKFNLKSFESFITFAIVS